MRERLLSKTLLIQAAFPLMGLSCVIYRVSTENETETQPGATRVLILKFECPGNGPCRFGGSLLRFSLVAEEGQVSNGYRYKIPQRHIGGLIA
jgi:hypothetical protein